MSPRSVVVEMIRSVPRRLPGGETETLSGGQRYILPGDEADALCAPSPEGGPAAKKVAEYDNVPQRQPEPAAEDE